MVTGPESALEPSLLQLSAILEVRTGISILPTEKQWLRGETGTQVHSPCPMQGTRHGETLRSHG